MPGDVDAGDAAALAFQGRRQQPRALAESGPGREQADDGERVGAFRRAQGLAVAPSPDLCRQADLDVDAQDPPGLDEPDQRRAQRPRQQPCQAEAEHAGLSPP